MSAAELLEFFNKQLAAQAEHQRQMERLLTQLAADKQPTAAPGGAAAAAPPVTAIPSFVPFDETTELWSDYWTRFQTFVGAHSIPDTKKAQVFLTNQSSAKYRLLCNLAAQQTPPVDINSLPMETIVTFMKSQFDPSLFVVRERFKFWSNMQRKPGESIQELAARIRQDAATCDFPSITDPQDEAMRTRFMCSLNNEAVLKALFKVKAEELTFAKAICIATEIEEAAKVAKETVYGTKPKPVLKIQGKQNLQKKTTQGDAANAISTVTCLRCGKKGHKSTDCRHKDTTCRYCKKTGHLESVCFKKKRDSDKVTLITQEPLAKVNRIQDLGAPKQSVLLDGRSFTFEVDTGARDNFCSEDVWTQLGKPSLRAPHSRYYAASGDPLPVLGVFTTRASLDNGKSEDLDFNVATVPHLNLLGRLAVNQMDIDLKSLLSGQAVHVLQHDESHDEMLYKACMDLCDSFPDLFKPELGCLKDFELDVRFKPDAEPRFCKPRPVPFALQEDLNQAYDAGIRRGVWEPTTFNAYGTPVVPIRKALLPGQQKAKIRVCGDYSVTVNAQLETHRQPMPRPEDLMRKLSGGYFFTKVDLADAYNQIKLSPESQKRLALSTHRGVLLQKRLPFGISSAPGYFQEVMEQLTSDLPGVAVYLDDILVSGANAEEHLRNLKNLFQRLQDKGLRCKKEKCEFAQPSVVYLGHTLSRHGIAKGAKVDAILQMEPPTNLAELRSFIGSVQFYGKFIKDLATILEPLTLLTRKDVHWHWGKEQQTAFQHLKDVLCSDTVLAHFDPSLEVGLSCDASSVGVGAVLFHRYPDGEERPIAYASKKMTATQQRYSQIQREALAVIFGLNKFHQFLYGRHFYLITDHKPLLALFGPNKGTPALAANRLARWALQLSQYDYSIEFRKTEDHGNADALSRLPVGHDDNFDEEETDADVDTVCTVKTVSLQINPTDSVSLQKNTAKDPVLATVMRYTREGWPVTVDSDALKHYKKLESSLTTANGCLFHGSRLVIPRDLRPNVLEILHMGHFGRQRMKQLARSVVYWPGIDSDIESTSKNCTACAEHQNQPSKPANHPWMLPERPWSRVHVDHAINFLGSNWLIVVDAYSKYPCIHQTSAVTAKVTMELLEQDFAHFGFPHAIVSDNAPTFRSDEFQTWCRERGITHLTGAPYHPATNGAAERLVQTFKQAMRKSSLPPKAALQEFLMLYRRTPLDFGFSPSELLNGRQIRCQIDTLLPSPVHLAQKKQSKEAMKSQMTSQVSKLTHTYDVGTPCYALYYGPRRDRDARWVPATVIKVYGTRSVNVRVHPRGPIWRRHLDQLRPRYGTDEDSDPGEAPSIPSEVCDTLPAPGSSNTTSTRKRPYRNPRLPNDDTHGPHNPRRSARLKTK